MVQTVAIDTRKLLDVMNVATRRASAFMSLGLRAANDLSVETLTLDSNFQIQFLPNPPPANLIRNVQSSFSTWIVGNGIRELDQHASIFADSLYYIRTILNFNGVPLSQTALDRTERFKSRTNVAEKLRIISEEFGISSAHTQYMDGLSRARNALTHNLGVVGPRHINQSNGLKVAWLGMQLIIGDQTITGDFEPIYVEKDTAIKVGFLTVEKIFCLGLPISLTPHDLHGICFTYQMMAQELVKSLEGQMRDLGIVAEASPVEKAVHDIS
jgi:hypothetical protein